MDKRDLTFTAADINPRQKALFDQYTEYYLRHIKEEYDRRGRFWQRDFSGPEAYARSVEPNRRHFLEAIGGWPWERGDLGLRREKVAELPAFTVERVHYQILDSISTDALRMACSLDSW